PAGGDALDEEGGGVEILGAEEYPGQADEMEGNEGEGDPADQRGAPALGPGHGQAFEGQPAAMQRAPDHELPLGPVPDAAQQHGDDEVAIGLERAVAAAAQGL